jgi:HEPN domain-containing protein
MARRHEDWLSQAERDLKAARDSLSSGNYEWSAFQSQQAAEKALKALLQYFNREVREHSVVRLLEEARASVEPPRGLMVAARELDRHYIQSRYPNGFPAGYPGEYYDERLAERCIDYAQEVLNFVKGIVS